MNDIIYIKTIEELGKMSREERMDYFKSLPILQLKKYFGKSVKNPTYGDLHEVYLEKRGK